MEAASEAKQVVPITNKKVLPTNTNTCLQSIFFEKALVMAYFSFMVLGNRQVFSFAPHALLRRPGTGSFVVVVKPDPGWLEKAAQS